jgi:hypothetical protein
MSTQVKKRKAEAKDAPLQPGKKSKTSKKASSKSSIVEAKVEGFVRAAKTHAQGVDASGEKDALAKAKKMAATMAQLKCEQKKIDPKLDELRKQKKALRAANKARGLAAAAADPNFWTCNVCNVVVDAGR